MGSSNQVCLLLPRATVWKGGAAGHGICFSGLLCGIQVAGSAVNFSIYAAGSAVNFLMAFLSCLCSSGDTS